MATWCTPSHFVVANSGKYKFKNAAEIVYLIQLLRWERDAPPDGQIGRLDGELQCNSQIARMANVINTVATGQVEAYERLSCCMPRRDGEPYITSRPHKLKRSHPLRDGWYLEGCMSLEQKQSQLDALRWGLGLSEALIRCAKDFVAGIGISRHIPSEAQLDELTRRLLN